MKFKTSDYSDDQPEFSFKPITPGRHVCRIAEANLTESAAGNAMIEMEWEIISKQDRGRTFKDWFVLSSDTGMTRLAKICKCSDPPILGSGESEDGLNPSDQLSINDHLVDTVICVETYNKKNGSGYINTRSGKFFALTDDQKATVEDSGYSVSGSEDSLDLPF